MILGYHASHEQFHPSHLLRFVERAEMVGFNGVLSSDHFHPWGEAQGHSSLAWSWLGAAMRSTALSFGVVTAPVQRYNPAIIAQGAATLSEMFPGRFWMAVGSGQLLNEGITGERWPTKAIRNDRLKEAAKVMKDLWDGRTVDHRGLVTVEEAKLYTRPGDPPLMAGAALSPETAEFVGGWADGLITTSRPREDLVDLINAFRRGGGKGKPMFLKVQVSYARDEDVALREAWEQWKTNVFPHDVSTAMRTPQQYDSAASVVRPEDMIKKVRVSSDLGRHLSMIEDDIALGFERIYLHNVARTQDEFIEDFGREIVPSILER
jgi:probable non-F420 flavinoid oxidoreductase